MKKIITFFSAKIVWILARKPDPPNTTIERAYNVLNKFNISTSPLMKTDQASCSPEKNSN